MEIQTLIDQYKAKETEEEQHLDLPAVEGTPLADAYDRYYTYKGIIRILERHLCGDVSLKRLIEIFETDSTSNQNTDIAKRIYCETLKEIQSLS